MVGPTAVTPGSSDLSLTQTVSKDFMKKYNGSKWDMTNALPEANDIAGPGNKVLDRHLTST